MDSLTIPEGQQRDEELGKAFLDIVNDDKLTRKELAQKLVDMYSGTMSKFLEAQKAALDAENEKARQAMAQEDTEWANAAKSDPEWGSWEVAAPYVAKGRDVLGTPELFKFLQDQFMGNHPEILRMFYRAGKLVSEDLSNGKSASNEQVNVANASWGKLTEKYFASR